MCKQCSPISDAQTDAASDQCLYCLSLIQQFMLYINRKVNEFKFWDTSGNLFIYPNIYDNTVTACASAKPRLAYASTQSDPGFALPKYGPRLAKKVPSNTLRFIPSCACAKCHPGLCSPLIHYVVSNDYISV